MKKQFLAAFALVSLLFLTSCSKDNIETALQDNNEFLTLKSNKSSKEDFLVYKTINNIDTIIVAGVNSRGLRVRGQSRKVAVDLKVDLQINKITGEIKAILQTPIPGRGWNIGYALYKGEEKRSEELFSGLKVDTTEFKVIKFPTRKQEGKYKLKLSVSATTSIKPILYTDELVFKID
jgi:hypothetical protein